MKKPTPSAMNVAAARAAWGDVVPDWILILAEECDSSTQAAVAKRLGVSPPVVNQVLKCAYKGRLDGVEQRVRGELRGAVVMCPVLGEISTRACLDHQSRGYESTNWMRVALARACRTCKNRRDS